MQAEKSASNYTFDLTQVQSECSVSVVPKLKHIVSGLSRQGSRQYKDVSAANNELNGMREVIQRFRELEQATKPKEESMRIAFALVLNLPQKIKAEMDAFATPEDEAEIEAAAMEIGSLDLSAFPLWKIMREVVRQTSEIRVYELEGHLKSFGVKAERSAIESALLKHKKEFKVYKRGREKYVALKGV